MKRLVKTALLIIFSAAVCGYAQEGSYCRGPGFNFSGIAGVDKNFADKLDKMYANYECVQIKAGNKAEFDLSMVDKLKYNYNNDLTMSSTQPFDVTMAKEKSKLLGTYSKADNNISITINEPANKKTFVAYFKSGVLLLTQSRVESMCQNVVIFRRQTLSGKTFPKTLQGLEECRKEGMRQSWLNRDGTSSKPEFDNMTYDDSLFRSTALNASGNYVLVGNSLHQLDQNCNSIAVFTKVGSKATPFTFDRSKQYCSNKGWIKEKELTDARDGKKYKTTKIGTQEWMGENLNWHGKDGYYGLCKNEEPKNCEKKGRLYDWAEAANLDRKYNDEYWKDSTYWAKSMNYKGICPEGWYLPDVKDWQTLFQFLGGEKEAWKKLAVKVEAEDLSRCKIISEDDRGRKTEQNNCPTDEYDFSYGYVVLNGGHKYSLNIMPDKFWLASEYYGHGSRRGEANYIYAIYPELGISREEKKELKYVRCIKESAEAKAAAEKAQQEAKAAAEKAQQEAKAAAEKAQQEAKAAAEKAQQEAKEAEAKVAAEKAAAAAKQKAMAEKFSKTTLKDSDGKNYKLVILGEQIWMMENLRDNAKGSKCFDNRPSECEGRGRLYDWNTAQKVCPKGWRLPNPDDWAKAMATANQIGKNEFLSRNSGLEENTDYFTDFGSRWWSSKDEGKSGLALFIGTYESGWQKIEKQLGSSVRCLMDDAAPASAAVPPVAAKPVPEPKPAPEPKAAPVQKTTTKPPQAKPAPTPEPKATTPAKKTTAKPPVAKAAPQEEDEEEVIEEKPKPKKKAKPKKEEEVEMGEMEIGARVAYNGTMLLYEAQDFGLGHGIEIGGFANIELAEDFKISIGANAVYRKPQNKTETDENSRITTTTELTEYVFSIPAMIQYHKEISDLALYLQAGLQIDVPLKSEQKITIGGGSTFHECPWRNSYDLGFAFGLGWRIDDTWAIDIKGIRSLTEFNKDIGGYVLIQGTAGVSYFF